MGTTTTENRYDRLFIVFEIYNNYLQRYYLFGLLYTCTCIMFSFIL